MTVVNLALRLGCRVFQGPHGPLNIIVRRDPCFYAQRDAKGRWVVINIRGIGHWGGARKLSLRLPEIKL